MCLLNVMCLSADVGSVLKVISVPRGSWSNTELLLEELQVFKVGERVLWGGLLNWTS